MHTQIQGVTAFTLLLAIIPIKRTLRLKEWRGLALIDKDILGIRRVRVDHHGSFHKEVEIIGYGPCLDQGAHLCRKSVIPPCQITPHLNNFAKKRCRYKQTTVAHHGSFHGEGTTPWRFFFIIA